MEYYRRLKDLKEDADLTQKDVANIIGVSINHYGKYERGEIDIPLKKAIMLANYYNVPLDYIAGRTNTVLNPEELKLLEKYSNLSERNKGKLELFLDQLILQQDKTK